MAVLQKLASEWQYFLGGRRTPCKIASTLKKTTQKMAYKKIDKEFCLSDDSVNCYGYRLLTSGLKLERFNPPIGFLMHNREAGVAVRWEDLVVRDGCLFGRPSVNETAFPDLAKQIEEGFYAAASVGHIVALKMTDDDSQKIEGQTGPTVLEWFPREISIVDIPGNYNAIAQLYDEADNLLHDLSDNLKSITMPKASIELEALGLPNLSADATVEQVQEAIRDLVAKAKRVDEAEKALHELQEQTNRDKVDALLKAALDAHKINAASAEKLKADYGGEPEKLAALLEDMPAQQTIAQRLNTDIPEEYRDKTWAELYATGKLKALKKNFPEYYKELCEKR